MARPTELTPERITIIEACIKSGLSNEGAARVAGVGERSFYRWMQAGETEEGTELEQELWQRVTAAQGFADQAAVTTIWKDVQRNVETAKWWLQVRRSREWTAKQQIDMTVRQTTFSAEELEQLERLATPEEWGQIAGGGDEAGKVAVTVLARLKGGAT